MKKKDFLDIFEYFLSENIEFFKTKLIDDINNSDQNYYFEGFLNTLFTNPSYELDRLKVAKSILDSSLQIAVEDDNLVFIISNYFKIPEFGTAEYKNYLNEGYAISENLENEFWSIKYHRETFNIYSNFEGYSDIEISENQIYDLAVKEFNYDVTAWIEYIKRLIDIFFKNNFSFSCENFVDQIIFDFEFNEKDFKRGLKQGRLSNPIIYFTIKEKLPNKSGEILLTGKLENPYTSPPALPIDVFIAKNLVSENEVKKMYKIIKCGGKLHIIHDNMYMLKIKKHLFYYFYLLKTYYQSYFDFIEKTTNDTMRLLNATK